MSDSSIVGDIAIWLVPVALLTVWCVQDGNWVLVAGIAAFLAGFAGFAWWLWRRTVRHDLAVAARRPELAELEEVAR